MDLSTMIAMAQTVLQFLDSSFMDDIGNVQSFKSQLQKMKDTMSTVKAVLLDAELQEKHQVQRSQAEDDWLLKLRDVVYEADDLFDEVATIAQREKLDDGVGEKVCFLLSRPLSLLSASHKIKKIREKLDAIAKDRCNFGGSYVSRQSHPSIYASEGSNSKKTRVESHSFVCDEDVIGRDDDKKAVIDMLLDPSVEEDVSCMTIVGIGGLGKTTLVKLAYNDERIQGEFALRLWVSVSQIFDAYKILPRILELLTDSRYEFFGIEQQRIRLQKEIRGKRYLLVLDDLWIENREEWLKLRDILTVGGKGSKSKILVTTRSQLVARVIGSNPTYELEGLSLKDSWDLFKRMAFEEGEEQMDVELVEIGREIIRRCANIPLAIRIVSSLLYGQSKSKWRSFRDIDLIHLKQDGVLPVLKLSYLHLESPLKSCFQYCALFPMGYVIEKDTLIQLWIAQGFIVPSYGRSDEETGEEYFMTMLHRGFFQDVRQNDHGEVKSCIIPEVMHTLAQEAAKLEISVANSDTSQLNGKLRHLSIQDSFPANEAFASQGMANCLVKTMRTLFQIRVGPPVKLSISRTLISKGRCLRVLDLQTSNIKYLPTLKNLLHLRYLDLSYNPLRTLPNSLAKLHNLQTLKLNGCAKLRELLPGLRNLVNLKHLETSNCTSLTHMPPGISKLTSLQHLTTFWVGHTDIIKPVHGTNDLNHLKALINLKGSLRIKVQQISIDPKEIEGAGYLMSLKHLTDIHLDWSSCTVKISDQEALMKELQPHYNLRNFGLKFYSGVRFPRWDLFENLGAYLSNLVKISLNHCPRLQHLPSMNKLPYLKTLELRELNDLEYIENNDKDFIHQGSSCSKSTSDKSFFPSLEMLSLQKLPKLKGWCASSHQKQLFPRLFVLEVHNCPILTSIPLCQNIKDLKLIKFNEALLPFKSSNYKVVADPSDSYSSIHMLKRLMLDNVEYLKSWPMAVLQQLCYMEIHNAELESMAKVEKVFKRCISSLMSLDINCCSQLRSLSGGALEHLTALETLKFISLGSLSFSTEDVKPWKSLHHSLRTLEFADIPKLVNLPKGIQYLTGLQSLNILTCPNLEALPEWISYLSSLKSLSIRGANLKTLPKEMENLTSLRSLVISSCSPDFKARCQNPTGEDWPKIEHIPSVQIE